METIFVLGYVGMVKGQRTAQLNQHITYYNNLSPAVGDASIRRISNHNTLLTKNYCTIQYGEN